ncbi:MAG: hypothetical protein AAF702_18765 [Chloroflexota bacterium]
MAVLEREVNRTQLVAGISDYFHSEHWNNFLNHHLDNPSEEIWHSHIYLSTSIHPDSLVPIVEGFFAARGQELVRCIDYLTPKPETELGALHNIHPKGKPHFDLFFRFDRNAILEPMPVEKAEQGQNALSWGKSYMDEFYAQFPFQAIGPTEEEQLDNYFASRHWKDTLNLIMDPDIIHLHCNLRLGIDPKILEIKARGAFAAQGWTIDKVVPNVFQVQGAYRGKLVFLGRHPELVYDLGWLFDPTVICEPSFEPWSRHDVQPGFDLCFTSEFNALIEKNPYVRLQDEEIEKIVAGF